MRERIVDAAAALFVEHGFDGVAMREIAETCGITKAALYYHFTGKAELLGVVFEDYLDEVAGAVRAGSGVEGSQADRLRAVIHALFALPAERRAIMRLAMHDVSRLEAPQQQAFGGAYRERFLLPLQSLIATGIELGEFRDLPVELVERMLLGMLYPFFAPPGPRSTPVGAQEIDQLLDVFCHGLVADPEN